MPPPLPSLADSALPEQGRDTGGPGEVAGQGPGSVEEPRETRDRASRRHAPRLATAWLVPYGLWLVFLCAVVARSGSWEAWAKPRWDGNHYISIAAHGYEIHRCGTPPAWCGNPWFPGWPYANEAVAFALGVRALGVSFDYVFIATAAASLLVLLVLSFRNALVFMSAPQTWAPRERHLGLWTCAGLLCQPGGFYLLTHFPYAFVFLLALMFRILTMMPARLRCSPRIGTWLAAFVAFWSSLSYPTMFLFALYPFGRFVSEGPYRNVRGWMRLALWMGVFCSGILCVCLIFYFKFGVFWLYFQHQAQYPRGAALVSTLSVLVDLLRAGCENERLTFLWYAFGFTVICLRLRNAHREVSLWFVLLVLVFYPATGSWIGIYRYYLLAFPMFVLLGATSCSRLLKIGYLAVGLVLQFCVLYPQYLNGRLM